MDFSWISTKLFLRILLVSVGPRYISEDFGSGFFLGQCQDRIFPGSVPDSFSRRNISEHFCSGFFLDRCQGIFLRILVVGFFLGQHQTSFQGEIFLMIWVLDFSWINTRFFF